MREAKADAETPDALRPVAVGAASRQPSPFGGFVVCVTRNRLTVWPRRPNNRAVLNQPEISVHHSDRTVQFSCGPRHRVVVSTYRFPWARALLSCLLLGVLGFVLTLMVAGPAHAADQTTELKAAAERLNSTCRDDPKAVGACMARDGVLAQLKREGHCWNAKAPTPATLWQACPASTRNRLTDACEVTAEIAYDLARARDTGVTPREAYAQAVAMAQRAGLSPAPLQAMTWTIYAELGAVQAPAIRHASHHECRRMRGAL